MKNTSGSVDFLYGTRFGRGILKAVMGLHLDRIAVWFLRSPLSKPMIGRYARKNGIALTDEQKRSFRSYRDFFVRTRDDLEIDGTPEHLISPCDGWLSVFPIDGEQSFSIKKSHYRVSDFLQDEVLAEKYRDGTLLVFRLCASDYHHYCYVDDGYTGENHPIQGVLHSVQPIACETYPVYVLNKRSWCLLATEHFGPVVQCEIGALVVGGIANEKENASFRKGEEKGHFELAGSTIVLLFERGRISLNAEIEESLARSEEARVLLGQWIGVAATSGSGTDGSFTSLC